MHPTEDSSSPQSFKKLQKKAAIAEKELQKEKELRFQSELKEKRIEEKRNAFFHNNNDSLSFLDFYKMGASIWNYPNTFTIVEIFIPFFIYMTPAAFDFEEALQTHINWGFHYLIALILIQYLAPIIWNIFKAIRYRRRFLNLTYGISGLGRLVHRCKDLNYFRRCVVRINFNEPDNLSNQDLLSIEKDSMKVLISEAKKITNGKYIFSENYWSVKGNCVIGYANWEAAGRILNFLNSSLNSLHQEYNMVHSVEIEFPASDSSTSDYFEWTPEGD